MRSFESLMKDINEEKGPRMVFDIDRFKRFLENPPRPAMLLNLPVLLYITFNTPLYERIPPLEQIAGDLKMDIETVKETIAELKDCGVLED